MPLDTEDKIQLAIAYAIRISILFAIITSIFNKDWLIVFTSSLILVLTFLPSFLEKNLKIYFPIEIELIILLFIYGTLYLGNVHAYYELYWWWDLFLHGVAGVMLGAAGFLLVYTLNKEKRVKVNLSPAFVALFACAFAISIGAIWEIFEFTMDVSFGFNLQRSGLVDTMWDIIVDTFAAMIISAAGYMYMKKGNFFILGGVIRRFVKKNPRLFRNEVN